MVSRLFQYNGSKGGKGAYQAHIVCPGHQLEIIADLPEQINIAVEGDWESPLPYQLTNMLDNIIGGLSQQAFQAFGANPQLQNLSYQVWMGTSPIEIPITLLFDATNSAYNDVYKPIIALMSMVLPINARNGWLVPPGPVRGNVGGRGQGYGVHVRLGNIIQLADCIIVSGSETFDTKLDSQGYPISGEIELTIRTSKVYGHKDWLTACGINTSGIGEPDHRAYQYDIITPREGE